MNKECLTFADDAKYGAPMFFFSFIPFIPFIQGLGTGNREPGTGQLDSKTVY